MSARAVDVTTFTGAVAASKRDAVAEEEPLELQVQGHPVAVVMRTPGHDEELALGFLITEGIVARAQDVLRIKHCDVVPTPAAEDNVVQVTLRPGVPYDPERLRRNLYASSSCGVCGKATLENVLRAQPPLAVTTTVSPAVLYGLPGKLRAAQRGFDATGGLHAAGLFTLHGDPVVVREDVGRHNAVDKVVGFMAGHGVDPAQHVLLVSGRVSFEVVQKAGAARLPVVAGISAPTSLAVELAATLQLTLVGFLRGCAMNVYSCPARVTPG